MAAVLKRFIDKIIALAILGALARAGRNITGKSK